jgi:hypothetical protein
MDKVFVLKSLKRNKEFAIKASSIIVYKYYEGDNYKTIEVYTNIKKFEFVRCISDWDNWDEFVLNIKNYFQSINKIGDS